MLIAELQKNQLEVTMQYRLWLILAVLLDLSWNVIAILDFFLIGPMTWAMSEA